MIDAVTLSSLARGLSGVGAEKDSMATTAAGTPGAAGQPTFVDVLKDAANTMVGDLKGAEATSFAAIQGKASTRQVVDAVMAADRSLQTALAIRDKVVSAYLDITKMPI